MNSPNSEQIKPAKSLGFIKFFCFYFYDSKKCISKLLHAMINVVNLVVRNEGFSGKKNI